MKTKHISIAVIAAMVSLPTMAQETYESAKIATEDLNGTARYVGMGGAMEALGADISTMSTNPAGIGLFRRSSASFSFGALNTPIEGDYLKSLGKYGADSKTPMSFDQGGFVISLNDGRSDSYINIGFNYHKSRNFNEVLSLVGRLNGASQSKMAYIKGLRGSSYAGGYSVDKNKNGEYMGYDDDKSEYTSRNFSQVDYILWNTFLVDPNTGEYGYNDGSDFAFARDQKGYIGEYDINLSGNVRDRVFWGFTVGLKDVNYRHTSAYRENLVDGNNSSVGDLFTVDDRNIDGYGFDIKGGIIFCPIEDNPFRIGLSVSTPTWYTLTSENYTTIANNTKYGLYDNGKSSESIKYKMYTPWKFGFSLGQTYGQDLAIGLSYEYADYSSIDNRNVTDEYYDDYYGNYDIDSESDRYMNDNTKECLKGVHTLKLGAEAKVTPELSLRAGYNYVSPMYKKTGMRSSCLDADGCYYMSTTDYVNWKDTHRVTCGLGYSFSNFNIDFAYQFSTQKGDFFPMETISTQGIVNSPNAVEVKNERHQFLMTLGFKL